MPRGGYRPGSGRKPSSISIRSCELAERAMRSRPNWCPDTASRRATFDHMAMQQACLFDSCRFWVAIETVGACRSTSEPRQAPPRYRAPIAGPDQAHHGQLWTLRVATRYIKDRTVNFPRTGCEQLIRQLRGFAIEEHDDVVDAAQIVRGPSDR
jgi:hypothetical protein